MYILQTRSTAQCTDFIIYSTEQFITPLTEPWPFTCQIKTYFTLQWFWFSMVIPICMQNLHHLLRTWVSSIMGKTVNYEVVPGNCSSTFTLPTPGWKCCRRCAGSGWPWSTDKADVGSQSCQGPGPSVNAAGTKSQHRSKTEEGMAPCARCKTHRSWTTRYWTKFWA